MEIRAKISLAVDQFKTNAAAVSGIFKDMTGDAQKYSKNVDNYIAKNLSNRINASNAGKIADIRNLTDFEREIYKSRRKMEKEALNAQMRGGGNEKQEVSIQQYKPKSLYRQEEIAMQKMVDMRAAEIRTIIGNGKIAIQNAKNVASETIKANARAVSAEIKQGKVNLDWKIAYLRRGAEYQRQFQAQEIKRIVETGKFQYRQAMANLDWQRASTRANLPSFNTEEFNKSLVRTRYALYDVGTKLTAFGAGIATALGASIMKAAEFEAAFTRVERTSGATGVELEKLKKSLLEIATVSPVSYEDITKIATLGAQMGIAADALDDFTKTVSNFSSITSVSVEETAQAFGRLGQLLDVPASKFENLSSAITYVGVNAVATDREILNMSESIAAAATQAGFAADEVVGMSAALASLKVRPEEARGVIVRLFREIDSSVSEGGTRLTDFANLMGYTSEQAASLWKQDPSKFFTSFLTGAKASGDLNNAITALGITNSRELNVIQRLANNTDVLASTMRDAREQYLLGTYASDAYSKVQDDLQSKLKILQNVLDQLGASFGNSVLEPMKAFIDTLINVGKFLGGIPGPVKLVLTLLAAMAGGMLLFKGTMMLAIAGLFAMKTAVEGLGGTSLRSMASISGLRAAMQGVGLASTKEALSVRILNGELVSNAKNAKLAALSNASMVAGAKAATAATTMLSRSLALLQKAFWPLMAIGLVATAVATATELFNASSQETKKLSDSMIEAGGGAEELRTALMKDTAVYNETGQAIGKLTFKYDENVQSQGRAKLAALETAIATESEVESIRGSTVATGEVIKAKDSNIKAQDELNALTERGTQLTKEQTVALGANTAAFVGRSLTAYGDEAKNIYEQFSTEIDLGIFKALGFEISGAIASGLSEDTSATEYLDTFKGQASDLTAALAQAYSEDTVGALTNKAAVAEKAIEKWGVANGKTAEEIDGLTEAMRENDFTAFKVDGLNELVKSIDAYKASIKTSAAAAELQIQVLQQQGFSAEVASDMVKGLSEQLTGYLEGSFATINATAKVNSAFIELSNGIKETDGSFDVFTESGRANMDNFQNFAVASLEAAKAAGTGFAGGLERIAAGLIVISKQGYDTGEAFSVMKNYIAEAAAGEQYTELANNIRNSTDPSQLSGIIDAWIKTFDLTTEAGKAALLYGSQLKGALGGGGYAKTFLMQWELTRKTTSQVAKNVKTILDYANELGNVLKEAVDIKFNRASGLIALKNTTADINKNIKEARQGIISLQASVSEKTAAKDQLNVDLNLASQFGDVATVSRIRAEIATLDAEISAAQEDIAYNVGITTGSLNLNTQAGRDNAESIKTLTASNADYIQSLVQSGVKGDKLTTAINKTKTAFENQLRAMGLSTTQIKEYSDIFDGFVTISQKVPNDVTVNANTDPATAALNNFLAKANASKASVTLNANAPTRAERYKALKDEETRLKTELKKYGTDTKAYSSQSALQWNEIKSQLKSLGTYMASGSYANGGLIGGFGGNKQDNVMINASRGEFMMSAASVGRYGVDFMNALNQQRVGISGFGGGMSAAGNSGGGVVYLSARDRELLQAVINRPITLRTSNRIIAESANQGNKELAGRGNN